MDSFTEEDMRLMRAYLSKFGNPRNNLQTLLFNILQTQTTKELEPKDYLTFLKDR